MHKEPTIFVLVGVVHEDLSPLDSFDDPLQVGPTQDGVGEEAPKSTF